MRILVYGDSNSWGYLDDGRGIRHADRWPVIMARQMSRADVPIALCEECLPGRTTTADDPREGPQFNGMTPFLPVLLSHKPIDRVIIMLGTNDLKARFQRSASQIADGVMALADLARSTPAGHGGWADVAPPHVTVIAPPKLGKRADDPDWIRYEEWLDGRERSAELPSLLASRCAEAGIHFIDANLHASSSDRDPIHWTAETHLRFGKAVAAHILAVA